MSEDDHSFLVQNCFPNLVKLLNSKQIYDNFKVTAYVKLVHLQLGPGLAKISVEFFVG